MQLLKHLNRAVKNTLTTFVKESKKIKEINNARQGAIAVTNRLKNKSITAKENLITFTNEKIVVTTKFLTYLGRDPLVQGVQVSLTLLTTATGLIYGLLVTTEKPLTESQMRGIIKDMNDEVQVQFENKMDELNRSWDEERKEFIVKQKELKEKNLELETANKKIARLQTQRNVMLAATFLVLGFWWVQQEESKY